MEEQPRLMPDIIGLIDRDFKVSYNSADAVMTALESFFESLDQQAEYDCKSKRDEDDWRIGATVYTDGSCTLLEATIYRTNEPNVFIITPIYADYLDIYMYRELCRKMIIYLADHVYQQCDHSRRNLELAQAPRGINPFLLHNQHEVQMEQYIVVDILDREPPKLLSIYFEHNLSASQSLSCIVKYNNVCNMIGEMIVDQYAAYQANQNNPQQDYRVGNAMLFVDVALKYAIGRPVREGDHPVSLETRTMCAYALCNVVNNVNCANFLRDINAVAGCDLVLAALDDSAKNYVLKKKMRELKDRLNPAPIG